MLLIAVGDIARDQLAGAGIDAVALVWRDILHEGPVPAGLDHWLGGVHLTGTDPAWRWDADAGRLRPV
jgi:hypothetical protein